MGEIDDKIDLREFLERIKSICHLYYAYSIMDICIYKIHQSLHLNILSVCVLVGGQGILQNALVGKDEFGDTNKVYVGRRGKEWEYFSLKAPDRKQMYVERQLFYHWRAIGVTFGGIIHACYSSPPPDHE